MGRHGWVEFIRLCVPLEEIVLKSRLPSVPQRILVINVARIGDTLLMAPVLRALRDSFPQAWIECLVHPKRIDAVAHLPSIDHWGGISKRSAPWRGFFTRPFDLALVFGREISLVEYALRVANHVVALPTGKASLDKRLHVKITDQGPLHAVHDRLRWLSAIAIPASKMRLEFGLTHSEQQQAAAWCSRHVAGARPLVGFQIASFPTKAYRNWPKEKFAELGKRIFSAYSGARILVFGDKGDKVRADSLVKMLGGGSISVAGAFTLRQTFLGRLFFMVSSEILKIWDSKNEKSARGE